MQANKNSFITSCNEREATLDRYIDEFREKYGLAGKSIKRDADIEYGLGKAYVDMGVRNIPGHKAEVGRKIKACFVKEFREYFHSSKPTDRDAFNKWHRKTCVSFLAKLNEELSEIECQEQHYGRAQKFVNMAFKYLYCYDDAFEYKDYFAYCHMPLDRFTTDWLFCGPDSRVSIGMTWSHLSEWGYYSMQKLIQDALDFREPELPTKPLIADFVIWGLAKEREQDNPLKPQSL